MSMGYKETFLDRGPAHHHPGSILPPGGGSEGWHLGGGIGVFTTRLDLAAVVVVVVAGTARRDTAVVDLVAVVVREVVVVSIDDKDGVVEGAGLKGVKVKPNFFSPAAFVDGGGVGEGTT